MASQPDAQRRSPENRLGIDVLAFPPDQGALKQRQAVELAPWDRLERSGRILLFFAAGMFLAWAAAIVAAFELAGVGDSTWFGVASVALAVVVIATYFGARWVINRANRGRANVRQRYADVTQHEAIPLMELARKDNVVEQYLRCVGRQRRALRQIERVALHSWAEVDATDSGEV